jgi:myosin-7
MAESGHAFVRELTKLQDLLSVERNVVFGNQLRRAKSVMRRGSDMESMNTRTNKAKPTVGDTFRRQLAALVDVLESTTPWYVRCIKPNAAKSSGIFDDELVKTQLQYSGMLDIVRIRKEGFPVHVPAESFVNKYHAMAGVMGKKLSSDPKEATREILTFIKAPTTEWQIGKTKVFLRNSVFEPLEENLRKLLDVHVTKIQAAVRGFLARRRFQRQRTAARKIQNKWRGMKQRRAFLKKRKAAVTIQAYTRGFFGREVAKELRRRKQEAEARRRTEEEERRRREAAEAGEAAMEKSMEEAKRQLLAMTKRAEQQAAASSAGGVSDLDKMFNISAGASEADATVVAEMSSELDAMLAGKPARPAGQRTIRRRKRADKAIEQSGVTTAGPPAAGPIAGPMAAVGVGGSADVGAAAPGTVTGRGPAPEENINPAEFSMLTFAERYFNDHPSGSSGTTRRSSTLRRGEKTVDHPIPKTEMIVFTKASSLPTSLVHMHNPENVELACSIWKDLNKQLRGELKEALLLQSTQSIIAYCIERPELRDEVYCQLVRQTTNNPKPDQQQRGWELLALCSISFPPGKMLYKYLQAFMKVAMADSVVGGMAAWALNSLRHTKLNGPRRLAPSALEIHAVRNLQNIVCRIYFLDGQAKAIAIESTWTAHDAIAELAQKLNLRDTDGWSLFETTPQSEHFIRGQEYIGDILAEWEAAKRTSMQMTKYTTMSRRSSGPTSALGGGDDARFVFRKRLFKNPREIPTDPVEYGLIYAQAVHSVTCMDEFPVNERVALQLAGLQAQVAWGDAKPSSLERYEEIDAYLPHRIHMSNTSRTPEDWQKLLFEAHRDYGTGMTPVKAKVLYLTAVKQYPLYGGTFFDVQYKGFWSHPARLYLTVHVDGFRFVSRTKDVLATYTYDDLANIEVNAYEDTITLNMVEHVGQDFMFSTRLKEDVANLIASYAPQHRNWKQVGTAPVTTRVVDLDNRSRLQSEVRMARKRLAESGMMQKPPETKSGFLSTTLRRKSKTDKTQVLEDFEKSYPERFWVYQKGKLPQSLTLLANPEAEESAIRCFGSLLVHAGLANTGGVETDGDPEHCVLIQNVIGRCLEKEDICNEFYLQLIKQTTEQPDPNGAINMANWGFFALTLGVVVPRNKLILNYISAHLRRCCAEVATGEAKFALYCQSILARTLDKKNRKYPPSRQEISCVKQMRPIHARFYFADGAFRALVFDAASTTAEVVDMIKQRIGLQPSAQGFSLFEVFGTLERNMLAWEKVADAIFKWEKYARSTESKRELQLTFKKRLFLAPFPIPTDEVEFSLVYSQAVDDVRGDRFPITNEEAAYLAALQAQSELGEFEANAELVDTYRKIVREQLPEYLHQAVLPEDVAAHHQKLTGLNKIECNRRYLKFVQAWPLYGATIFEVLQSYTTTLPKNLWLAVNESGIHILRRRTKEPLIAYGYKSIVNYSPSLRNLMIVTESLQRGTKFVFNTSQASQIAHLIKDYTHIIIQKRKVATAGGKARAAPAEQADSSSSWGNPSTSSGMSAGMV